MIPSETKGTVSSPCCTETQKQEFSRLNSPCGQPAVRCPASCTEQPHPHCMWGFSPVICPHGSLTGTVVCNEEAEEMQMSQRKRRCTLKVVRQGGWVSNKDFQRTSQKHKESRTQPETRGRTEAGFILKSWCCSVQQLTVRFYQQRSRHNLSPDSLSHPPPSSHTQICSPTNTRLQPACVHQKPS